jgi:hypothetical protein
MSEFLEKGRKFGVVVGTVEVVEHPAEEVIQFRAGGAQTGKVLDVTPLVAIQGRAEL